VVVGGRVNVTTPVESIPLLLSGVTVPLVVVIVTVAVVMPVSPGL
jgi:hypothetical protein